MTGFVRSSGRIGHLWQKKSYQCTTGTLRFQSVSNNLLGLLTVGAVIGTGVTITDYVIEWRYGNIYGPVLLITGVGSDPAIQAFHPFTNEPIRGGILYPVIRYIVIDGIRYSPYFRLGQFSPDLFTCLGTVNVQNFNCSNGGAGTYSHSITYVNTLNPITSAERTVSFDLNSDGSSQFFAWKFTAFAVADRITISYVKINDQSNPVILADWIIGSNSYSSNFTSNPKIWGSNGTLTESLKQVIDLSKQTFTSGDYLTIQIRPRVIETSNTNTNWTLEMKCLTSFTTYAAPAGARTIDPTTVRLTWDSVNCRYYLKWKSLARYSEPAPWALYLQYGEYRSGWGWRDTVDYFTYFRKQISMNYSTWGNYACMGQTGSTRIVKTGPTLTLTFTNATDYNRYKTDYTNIVTAGYWTNYSSDNTNVLHYKRFMMNLRISPSCGDAYVNKMIECHHTSTWTWTDAELKLVINMTNTTNGMPNVACNTSWSVANTYVNAIATSISLADFDLTTNCCYGASNVNMRYHALTVLEDTSQVGTFGIGCYNPLAIDHILPVDWEQRSGYFGFNLFDISGTFTNTADPLNNFRLTNFLNTDGTRKTIGEIVYEKANGIQIIP